MKAQTFKILDPMDDLLDFSDEALFESDRRCTTREDSGERRTQLRPTWKLRTLGFIAATMAFSLLNFAYSL